MRITDFEVYKNLLKNNSGLVINEDKSYLLESRLNPVAKKWEYESLETMAAALQGVPDQKLVIDIVEAMTTNETSFFRDQRPFDRFKNIVLPEMIQRRAAQRKLRIWCAAASSGQEPYSLAMMIKEETIKLSGWNIEIIATDISKEILERAATGIYTQFEVQRGLPIQLLMKYFTQEGDKWQISQEIRDMVKYDYFNLLKPMNILGQFDIVFCRNVLIYFDEGDKRVILNNMSNQMQDDSFLFLGGAETVLGITDEFTTYPEERGLYVKNASPYLADK